eukprot:1156435-Pelagomonas_calceolata.AAC.3
MAKAPPGFGLLSVALGLRFPCKGLGSCWRGALNGRTLGALHRAHPGSCGPSCLQHRLSHTVISTVRELKALAVHAAAQGKPCQVAKDFCPAYKEARRLRGLNPELYVSRPTPPCIKRKGKGYKAVPAYVSSLALPALPPLHTTACVHPRRVVGPGSIALPSLLQGHDCLIQTHCDCGPTKLEGICVGP